MKSTLTNMVLSLGTITIVAAALLAGVYSVTKEPIEEANRQKTTEAIAAVLPEGVEIAEGMQVAIPNEERTVTVYTASKDGQPAGAAVESYSLDGFSGEINIIYGFDAEGTVTGFEVIQQAETPGLGAKMNDWFRMTEGRRSIIGLNSASNNLTVSKDGGDVDAITAATITSRAFLDALRRADAAFRQTTAN